MLAGPAGDGGRRGRHAVLAEFVEEARESLGREEHACEVAKASVFFQELTVLNSEVVGFLNLDGNFTFKLTNCILDTR